MASTSAAKRSSATKQSRNWLEMPDELMTNIFQRLDTKERLKGACKVCTTWRRICKENPAWWKVIVMHKDECETDDVLDELTKLAVDLSCGELIDITIKGFGSDDLLHQILLRSSKLKRLRLFRCLDMTGSGVTQAVGRAPQLEKLHLHGIGIKFKSEDIELIGRNCRQLKSLRMPKRYRGKADNCDDYAYVIADNMPELRHLKVCDGEMSNYGLWAIINGCPHLISLDVRNCHTIYLGRGIAQRCMERIKNFKHNSWTVGPELHL